MFYRVFKAVTPLIVSFGLVSCQAPADYKVSFATSGGVLFAVGVNVQKADGTPITDLASAIRASYNFDVEYMDYRLPNFTIKMVSSVLEQDPAGLAAVQVPGKSRQIIPSMLSATEALPLSFSISSDGEYLTADEMKAFTLSPESYGNFIASEVQSALSQTTALHLEGRDAVSNAAIQIDLKPKSVTYTCSVDADINAGAGTVSELRTIKLEDALHCSGSVLFVLK